MMSTTITTLPGVALDRLNAAICALEDAKRACDEHYQAIRAMHQTGHELETTLSEARQRFADALNAYREAVVGQ